MTNRNFEFDQPTENAIHIWPSTPPHTAEDDGFIPFLEPYLIDTPEPRGCVIINPGGGYSCRVDFESGDVARQFNKLGLHAFTCQYRIPPHRYPAAYVDIARSIQIVRHNACKWNVSPDKIAVCGFSAGGHLTSLIGVHNHPGNLQATDPIEQQSSRPDALILSYPVISTTNEEVIRGCFQNLLGENPTTEQLHHVSTEKHVTADTPPAFIWHTLNDEAVPVAHPLLFAEALRNHNVPHELHIYADGPHGLGLAPEDPHINTWSTLAYQWLKNMNW